MNALGMLLQAPGLANLLNYETLPVDICMQAEFCSMCGPKHCPMQTKFLMRILKVWRRCRRPKVGPCSLA